MVGEGKLASSVREEGRWFKRQVLELSLLADRKTLEGYERRLIDKLFFGGRDTTDTEAIRKRYRSTGFSPTALIDQPIRKRIQRLPGFGKPLPAPGRAPTAALFLAGLGFSIAEPMARGSLTIGPMLALTALWVMPPALFGYPLAYRYRRRADRLPVAAAAWLVPALLAVAGPLYLVYLGRFFGPLRLGLWGLLALVLLALAFFNSVVNMARTRDSQGAVAMRGRLASIRRLFKRELRRRQPQLEDAWFPYLLAFGLQKDVDRWFGSFGAGRSSQAHTYAGSGSFSGGSQGGWTGGGGAFGAAGATVAWGAAATGLASGVSKPSSGGSGGGSSGGSFSGGGGGGGW